METLKRKAEGKVMIDKRATLVVVCDTCGTVIRQMTGNPFDYIVADIGRIVHFKHGLVTWSRAKNIVLAGVREEKDFGR
jgi:hypothetical protein